jgi:hypothetical protein
MAEGYGRKRVDVCPFSLESCISAYTNKNEDALITYLKKTSAAPLLGIFYRIIRLLARIIHVGQPFKHLSAQLKISV